MASQYNAIDPTLSKWADANSLQWYSDYQDTEVRTFILNPTAKDRVQVWVEVPQGGNTVVHVGQNRKGISRLNRRVQFQTTRSELSNALDKALLTAWNWTSDENCPSP